jgi:hypothetical protein
MYINEVAPEEGVGTTGWLSDKTNGTTAAGLEFDSASG